MRSRSPGARISPCAPRARTTGVTKSSGESATGTSAARTMTARRLSPRRFVRHAPDSWRRSTSAGASLPGDEWIAGQRVRYLLEDSQPRLAAQVLEQCRAVRSWCEALGGLVQHASGEFAAAESLFSTALADMPEDERCRLSDIAPLLDDKLSDRYRQLDCASRAAFEKRWWWLAQPLY